MVPRWAKSVNPPRPRYTGCHRVTSWVRGVVQRVRGPSNVPTSFESIFFGSTLTLPASKRRVLVIWTEDGLFVGLPD